MSRRIAFVVNTNAPELPGENDGDQMFAMLTNPESGGCHPQLSSQFRVRNCENRSQFAKKLEEILDAWIPDDQLVFYFSGHGSRSNDEYCLELNEARTQKYPFLSVLSQLRAAFVSKAIIILDTCFSGGADDAAKGGSDDNPMADVEMAPLPTGIAMLMSSGRYQTSRVDKSNNLSIFTSVLLEAVNTGLGDATSPDDLIGVDEANAYVAKRFEQLRRDGYDQQPRLAIRNATSRIYIAKNKTRSPEPTSVPIDSAERLAAVQEQRPTIRPYFGANSDKVDLDLDLVDEYIKTRVRQGDDRPPLKRAAESGLRHLDKAARDKIFLLLRLFASSSYSGAPEFTQASILCFVRRPDDYFPSVYATFEYKRTLEKEIRFSVYGPLSAQIEKLVEHTNDYLFRVDPSKLQFNHLLDLSGKRIDLRAGDTDLSRDFVRELISNAIVHRNYREDANSKRVKVIVTDDALIIKNPGELPDALWEDILDKDKSADGCTNTRNGTLKRYLSSHGRFEGEATGTRAIRDYVRAYGKDSVTCESSNGAVVVCVRRILYRWLRTDDLESYWLKQKEYLDRDERYQHRYYVKQSVEVSLEQARVVSDASHDAIDAIMNALRSDEARVALVLGEFGIGKTFLLREIAREIHASGGGVKPMLIEMSQREKSFSFNGLISQHLAENDVTQLDISKIRDEIAGGRIVLLLDGLDELTHRVNYQSFSKNFVALLQAASGKAKIVVTSRSQAFPSMQAAKETLREKAAGFSGVLIFAELQEFTSGHIYRFFVKRLGNVGGAKKRHERIKRLGPLAELVRNPRMLSFLAEVDLDDHQILDEARMPILGLVYQKLLTAWLQFEANRPREVGSTGLTALQRWGVMLELACYMWEIGTKSIRIEDIPPEVYERIARNLSGELPRETVEHQVFSSTLLVWDENEEGAYRFLHDSILTWLIAKGAVDALQRASGEPVLAGKLIDELCAEFFVNLAGMQRALDWAQRTQQEQKDTGSILERNATLVLSKTTRGRINLEDADLRGQSWAGADFRDAPMARADLSFARFSSASLDGANLEEATLIGVDLTAATLRGANLCGANAMGAGCLGADFEGAKLTGARLRYAKLIGAKDLDVEGVDCFGAALPDAVDISPRWAHGMSPCAVVAFSPDGGVLVSGHEDGTVLLWALRWEALQESGKVVREIPSGRIVEQIQSRGPKVRSIVLAGSRVAVGADDGSVRIRDLGDKMERLIQGTGPISDIAFNHLGGRIACADANGVRVFNLDAPERTKRKRRLSSTVRSRLRFQSSVNSPAQPPTLSCPAEVLRMVFHPERDLLTIALDNGTITLWDLDTGEAKDLLGHNGAVTSLAFDGRGMLASCSVDRTVRLWDTSTHESRLLGNSSHHASPVADLAFSADGKLLVSADEACLVAWDIAAGTRFEFDPEGRGASYVVFHPNRRVLAGVTGKGELQLWQLEKAIERVEARSVDRIDGVPRIEVKSGSQGSVNAVVFEPSGRRLISSAWDNTLRLTMTRTGVSEILEGAGAPITGIAPDAAGALVAASAEQMLVAWDLSQKMKLGTIYELRASITSIAMHPSGRYVATSLSDGQLQCFELRRSDGAPSIHVAGDLQQRLANVHRTSRRLAFSPDGSLLVTGSLHGTLRVWSLEDGTLISELHRREDPDSVTGVVFSPDGQLIAASFANGELRLWDRGAPSYRAIHAHTEQINAMAFSPQGERIATASSDGSIKLWHCDSGDLSLELTGHTRSVRSVAFHPSGNGDILVSSSIDGTLRYWALPDGTGIATILPVHDGWVAFARSGRYKHEGPVQEYFWHTAGLCRFEVGELDDVVDWLLIGRDEPLHPQLESLPDI